MKLSVRLECWTGWASYRIPVVASIGRLDISYKQPVMKINMKAMFIQCLVVCFLGFFLKKVRESKRGGYHVS